MLSHFSIISVPVSDQQRAKEFYLKFGFELIIENKMGPEQTWIQLGLPGAQTSITLVNWFPQFPIGSLRGLVLDTDDIEAEVARLNAAGIETGTIDKTPRGKFCSVKDPDGNVISLHGNN